MRLALLRILIGLVAFFALFAVGFSQTCTEPGSIRQVRNRNAGSIEYVIFDVIKEPGSADSNPVYSVTNAAPPFTDYSGDERINVNGKKFKKIVFRSIFWLCQTQVKPSIPQPLVKDVKLLYSFEGIAEFVVGYKAGSRFAGAYHYDAGSVTKVVLKFRK